MLNKAFTSTVYALYKNSTTQYIQGKGEGLQSSTTWLSYKNTKNCFEESK